LRGSGIRPDSRVTLRTSTNWRADHPCTYDPATEEWWTEVAVQDHDLEYKFRCDGRWQTGPNGRLTRAQQLAGPLWETAGPGSFDGRRTEPLVQNPEPARSWLRPDLTGGGQYDVIVIGSGMGGGVLAHRLARGGARRVLLLEAGSYLFSTHFGDGPRAHFRRDLGGIDWTQWGRFKVQRCATTAAADGVDIGEGMYFGGRSLFWGAVTPRMRSWEFAGWPAGMPATLPAWYAAAEELMRASDRRSSAYEQDVLQALQRDLPEFSHAAAPLAIEYTGIADEVVPSGVFSTADLLIETVLSAEPDQPLTVNLNHEATRLVLAGGRVLSVEAFDRLAGVERTFDLAPRGTVVLAAGAIGTPTLALASGLDNDLIGRGLTDHPVRVRHFTIPPGAPLYRESSSGKTIAWNDAASPDRSPYNVLVETGRDLNQNRFTVHPSLLGRADGMPCEVSTLLQAPLLDGNRITVDRDGDVSVDMQRDTQREDSFQAEVDEFTERIIKSTGGDPTDDPSWRPLGAVSHEVGTMRMNADPGGGVVDANLKVHGQDNLYVCDLSVFPSSPAANPSLTLASLALRLADHLGG
jgi:choline dehydrogenase-like flavoprotein